MSPVLFTRLRRLRDRSLGRGLWFAAALLLLTVQITLPAHQAGHALGDKDVACLYCMQGGHLSGMASVAPPAPLSAARMEAPTLPATRITPADRFHSYHSRAPPAQI